MWFLGIGQNEIICDATEGEKTGSHAQGGRSFIRNIDRGECDRGCIEDSSRGGDSGIVPARGAEKHQGRQGGKRFFVVCQPDLPLVSVNRPAFGSPISMGWLEHFGRAW